MHNVRRGLTVAIAGVALLWAGTALAAPTDAKKCEAYKLKHAGKYGFCRLNAESKYVKTGDATKYSVLLSKCDAKFVDKWLKADGSTARHARRRKRAVKYNCGIMTLSKVL